MPFSKLFWEIAAFERVLLRRPPNHYTQEEMCILYLQHREERRKQRYWPHRLLHALSSALSIKFLNR